MDKIILHASDIDGFLSEKDINDLDKIESMYKKYTSYFEKIESGDKESEENIIYEAREIGKELERIVKEKSGIHVYSFETPKSMHPEASRIIQKLRNPKTKKAEFIYYIQRAFELLFSHAFSEQRINNKRAIIQKTPVSIPCQNYAVHVIPNIDDIAKNTVMCVMLRGALLPSMIVSKEIEDYTSNSYLTPFALFKVKRDENKNENNMEYVLDLKRSYFKKEDLDRKDLIFADPMNATGGSLLAILSYFKENNIKPKSIKVLNVISSLKGALRLRSMVKDIELYTLWMDPILNEKAYILPGLGDAGDRLNGIDLENKPRNLILLIADYGENIVSLYRSQVEEIEKTVLS